MMTVAELRELLATLPSHLVVRVWLPHDPFGRPDDMDCLDVQKAAMENLEGAGCFLALHAPSPIHS